MEFKINLITFIFLIASLVVIVGYILQPDINFKDKIIGFKDVKEKNITTTIKNATNITIPPEIEKIVSSINSLEKDKIAIKKQLSIQGYAEVIVEVRDKNKIDEILSNLSQEEFILKKTFRNRPPYTFSGNITLKGLEKLLGDQDIKQIYYNFHTAPTLQ